MDSEEIRGSRTEKLAKRRKNSRAIYLLLGIFLILLIIWIWMLVTSDKKDSSDKDTNQNKVEENEKTNDGNKPKEKDDENESKTDDKANDSLDEEEDQDEAEDDKEKEDKPEEGTDEEGNNLIENDPDDELVVKTYDNNWEVIPTEQEEPHSINFSKDTQDRNEIERAVMQATGLTEEDKMVVWWLENAGEQKIKATVSDRQEEEISRVHLQWVEAKGWQVLKVEVLKENDQKWRFQN